MKVAIVGFGDIEGQSAYRYYKKQGAAITICDMDASKDYPDDVASQLGEDHLKNLAGFDVVVRTPGLNPGILLAANPTIKDKVTTVIDEFLRVCPTKNVIGITGTKGKGTTSTLTAKMLEAAGKHVILGGNIGVAPLDYLPEITPESWVVLELSSFQLMDSRRSPHIAVCLMLVPEHLNWHYDVEDYKNAKANLFRYQQPTDIAIYFADNEWSHDVASVSPGAKIPFYADPGAYVREHRITIDNQIVCNVDELRLLGEHNWQNACAATTAVWQAGIHDTATIRSVLTTFTGLEHRLEFVRELDGVRYYNDSFGTTPETAIVAIKAFPEPKVVILGGSDKGSDYAELAQTIKDNNVRHVVLIGQMAPKIQSELEKVGFKHFSNGGNTMPEIVQHAREAAKAGDVVLLSTACASFDLFKDYKDRGTQFKLAVGALA